MTDKQKTALFTFCAAEMTGDRYDKLWDLCDDQKTIGTARLLHLIMEMQKQDTRRANELLRAMK